MLLACQEGVDRMVVGRMTSSPRKLALTTHVSVSVGWLGAVAAYLALAIAGLATRDSGRATAAYRSMELVAWLIIVPCSLAAFLSGFVKSLGTEWVLFRHVVHAVGGLLVLPTITALSVYKPYGRIGSGPRSSGERVSVT